MNKAQLIFRIRQVIRAIEQRSGLDELDLSAREILNFVGEAEAMGQRLSISDISRQAKFGTPPTVYARLGEIEKAGWIKLVPSADDGRVKHVTLTPLARKTFSRMSAETGKLLAGPNKVAASDS